MQKLAQICIRRPVFATMLVLALVVLGFDAYRKLGVDLFPKLDFPTVTVTTTLPGAAPEEIESQVTKRIEEAVNTISGIDDLRSISAEGVSQVFVQFVLEKDPEIAAQEVRDKIAQIQRNLPEDTDPPLIEKIATDAAPVINVVVASGRDLRETTKTVDDVIKKNIESLSGVGQVRFIGDRTRQIQVQLNGERLYAYHLNIDQVRASIAAQNVEIPGGRVDQGSRELSLRTMGRVERPEDFERIIVSSSGGNNVRLSDIAAISDNVEEPRSLARLDGQAAVVLEIRKQAGTNTLDVIQAVKNRVVELQKRLPGDFKVTYTRDQSKFISDSFHAVQEHLILGGVFAAIVVFAFMRNWRSTLITAIAIPTSIISTFTLMNAMGFTLNQITMLALVLMVGIVIDDAIVVLENIFRFAEEKGLSPMQAAIEGTRDIGLAVLATTFSLVIVFLPVAMMGGLVGKFMSSFGYTAAFAILVSLLVSFTLTPTLSARFLKIKPQSGHSSKDTGLFRYLDRGYSFLLRWSMAHRWVIVVLCLAVIYSTGPLFSSIGKDFLPKDDQSEFEVNVRMPAGSSLQGSDDVMKQLEGRLKSLPGVRNLLTTLGSDTRRQVDRGSILVELVPLEDRKEDQLSIMALARDRLKGFRDLTIGVQMPAAIQGAGSTAELQFFLQGPDLQQLDKYASRIKRRLSQVPGVADLDSSYESGKPELRVKINRDKAASLNVNVGSVATALRTLVGGDDQVTTYREGDDRYDVQLRVDKEFRNSPQALQRLFVPSATLGNVPVSNVASLEEATGPTQIERYNRQRQVMIMANLVGGQSLSNVLAILDQTIADLHMPAEYQTGLIGGTKEFGRAGKNFIIAFLLSILFMYMVLAAQFESFMDPVIILLSLPLAVPFAVLSLMLAGENYSLIYSSVGILVLFGIVKKNSILQIDHIKSLRANGVPVLEAILRGCEDRLRPILMTTASLVAGMIPMALGTGAGSASRRTVAIVVIGGQTLCLLLTLLVTPVAYSLVNDLANARIWSRISGLAGRYGVLVRRTAAGLILVLGLAAGASQLNGQDLAAPQRVGVTITERRLTLEETVRLALENNIEIDIERTNRDSAVESVKAARGFFDPSFRWQPLLQTLNTPTGSVLQGAGGKLTDRYFNQNFYLNQRLPGQGTQFAMGFENSRQATTNPFVSFNPLLTSRLFLGFTQPLLRGRETDRERGEILIRSKRADVAGVEFEIRAVDIVTRVEQAYWDLVAARQDVEVKQESVRLAREQLAINQRMVDSGTLAPVELSAADAELQRRLDTWFSSVGLVTEVENTLKQLIAPDTQSEIWRDQIIPVDRHLDDTIISDDLDQGVATALKTRPELRAVKMQRDVNDVEKKVASNARKPQLNAIAEYSLNGLGGSLRRGDNPFLASNAALYSRLNQLSAAAGLTPVEAANFGSVPGFLVGNYGTALSNLFAGRYQSFQVGLSVDFNFRNRTADANYSQMLIGEKRLKLQQAQLEQAVQAQVRNALQAIQTARQRIAAAESSARAAKEKLDSEMRLYQTGESTNFLVLTRQNEYSDSRRRLVVAQLDYNKSVSRLEQALGTTLNEHNVKLQ